MIIAKARMRTLLAAGTVALTVAAASTVAVVRSQSAHAGSTTIVPALPNNVCTAPAAHAALAAKLTRDISAAVHGRQTIFGIRVEDRRTGVECRYSEGRRFDSASVVKASILAAVLRWKQEARTSLTSTEKREATLMITQSDNNAATFFWNELGHARFQHYLSLATMTETIPGSGGLWGLTQVTARDELQQLRLLTARNSVLTDSSRAYELNLMAHVISSQRWGTPSGAPSGLNVYVKNGWLPRATLGWRINSIGAFTGHGRNYMIAMVTDNNPTMSYGVTTIQRVAQVVHRDLNAGLAPAGTPLAAMIISPAQQRPDEVLPASAAALP
jgi:beta-lactamase class A